MGLDINQVIAQIGAQNAVEGAGVLNAGSENLQVRVAGQFNSIDELKRFPVRTVNTSTGVASAIQLGDIADVRRDYVDPPAVKVRHQGQDVIAIGVSMTKGGDIIALGKALQRTMAQVQADLPVGITVSQVQDQPTAVGRSVGELVRVLIEAVASVLAVSFISLGLVRKLEEGYDKKRAATYAYDVAAMPMLTGTLITAAGFLPIGLAKSVTGEYTFAIIAVTSAALIISWFVSVYFVPYLGSLLLHTRSKAAAGVGAG